MNTKNKEKSKSQAAFWMVILPAITSFVLHIMAMLVLVLTSFVSHGGDSTPGWAKDVITPIFNMMKFIGSVIGEKAAGDFASGIFLVSVALSIVLWALGFFVVSVPLWVVFHNIKRWVSSK